MSIKKSILRTFSLGSAALTLFGADVVFAQDTPTTTTSQANQPGSIDTAVFARFSDLDAQNTRDRLDDLQASKTLSGPLASLLKQLDAGASSKELERYVLPLVVKLTADDAEVALAAIMRAYYLTYLQKELAAGNMNRNEVFNDLISTDEALTTATYGVIPPPKAHPAVSTKVRVSRR